MNVLDLFSGIGGFSLGLERAGFKTVAFCEIDLYCRAVLRKHWPNVPCYDDVTTLTAARLAADRIHEVLGDATQLLCDGREHNSGRNSKSSNAIPQSGNSGRIEVICGGFPCQDISVAGKGAGIEGERSGLWKEYARIIGEVRPRYVIVENVAALLGRGLGVVLGDLAALGYDAEWHCIPASAVGAPHRRDRVWVIAYTNESGPQRLCQQQIEQGSPRFFGGRLVGGCDWWFVEPNMGRVAHGVPSRVDRLRSLGNAIVPQIAEIIGRAIKWHL